MSFELTPEEQQQMADLLSNGCHQCQALFEQNARLQKELVNAKLSNEQLVISETNLIKELASAQRELSLVDAVLVRRPALDDEPTRYAKIEKAINVAKIADQLKQRAEQAEQKLSTYETSAYGWTNTLYHEKVVGELQSKLQQAEQKNQKLREALEVAAKSCAFQANEEKRRNDLAMMQGWLNDLERIKQALSSTTPTERREDVK